MSKVGVLLCLGPSLAGGRATANVTYEDIGVCLATAISADGSVIAGNTVGEYETFRWTAHTGIVPLGRASVPVLGRGAGTPDVSADGTRISATILGADSTYITQGRWTLGQGWQETMPPTPPDGGQIDLAYGSAWGISDDGEEVVGLYWRPGHAETGLAHPSHWTERSGVVDLGTRLRNGRANDADRDGSVVVGWEENSFGAWQPTAWVDGELTNLTPTDGFCEAVTVDPGGTIIGGSTWNVPLNLADAAVWRWNGASWVEEVLGHLPGTFPGYGYVTCNDMTADGSVIVGFNRFDNGFNSTGFIWTRETGMIDVVDFLVDNGVEIPAGFNILDLTAISDDGQVMTGLGQVTTPPYLNRSFVIRLTGTAGIGVASPSPAARPRFRLATNPTRGATAMSLDLPEDAEAELAVYSASGRLVGKLVEGPVAAGRHKLYWDGRDSAGTRAAPGVYFFRLVADSQEETHKLIVTR